MSQLVMTRDAVTGVVRYQHALDDLGLYYDFEQDPKEWKDPFDCVESIESLEE